MADPEQMSSNVEGNAAASNEAHSRHVCSTVTLHGRFTKLVVWVSMHQHKALHFAVQ